MFSSGLDEAQQNARQAKSAFEDAKKAAEECGCEEAAKNADDGYSYANRALMSSDLDGAKNLGRQAKSEADDAKKAADDCGR